jgi:hypothetical protein
MKPDIAVQPPIGKHGDEAAKRGNVVHRAGAMIRADRVPTPLAAASDRLSGDLEAERVR